MVKRLKNPVFLLAFTSLIYTLLKQSGVEIEEGLFRSIVDIISYILLGAGVYSSFGTPSKEE